MESSPANENHQMVESRFTCSQQKESISHRSSRKWSSGQQGTKIPATKRSSDKYKRTRNYFWRECDNAGPKRLERPVATSREKSSLRQVLGELVQRPLEALLHRFETGFAGKWSFRPQRLYDVDAGGAPRRQCPRHDRRGHQHN